MAANTCPRGPVKTHANAIRRVVSLDQVPRAVPYGARVMVVLIGPAHGGPGDAIGRFQNGLYRG